MVIIINGPSCAGKTSISQEICVRTGGSFVHVQVDQAKQYMFTILDRASTSPEVGRHICDTILLSTAKVFLEHGKNVVIDTTFDSDDAVKIAKRHINFFGSTKVLFVGIDCSTQERLRRFKQNNNNPVRNERTIIAQADVFERNKDFYDASFDSSIMDAGQIATNILNYIDIYCTQ